MHLEYTSQFFSKYNYFTHFEFKKCSRQRNFRNFKFLNCPNYINTTQRIVVTIVFWM